VDATRDLLGVEMTVSSKMAVKGRRKYSGAKMHFAKDRNRNAKVQVSVNAATRGLPERNLPIPSKG
jgi:hypothetical protein